MSSSETYVQDAPQSQVSDDYDPPKSRLGIWTNEEVTKNSTTEPLVAPVSTSIWTPTGDQIQYYPWPEYSSSPHSSGILGEVMLILHPIGICSACDSLVFEGYYDFVTYCGPTEVSPAQRELPSRDLELFSECPGPLVFEPFSMPADDDVERDLGSHWRIPESHLDPVVPWDEVRQHPKPIQRPTRIVDAPVAEAQPLQCVEEDFIEKAISEEVMGDEYMVSTILESQ